MEAKTPDDKLYLVCEDCRGLYPLARVFPFSSARFYGSAYSTLLDHCTHDHWFCYEDESVKVTRQLAEGQPASPLPDRGTVL